MKRTCHRETYNKVDNFSEDFIMRNFRQSPTKQPTEDMQDLVPSPRTKNKGPIRKSHTFKGQVRCTLPNWALKYRVGPF